jgi:hypothetical protein
LRRRPRPRGPPRKAEANALVECSVDRCGAMVPVRIPAAKGIALLWLTGPPPLVGQPDKESPSLETGCSGWGFDEGHLHTRP